MPDQVNFTAQRRELRGKKVRFLRRQGLLPANIYGRERESVPIQINGHDFGRFLATHPAATLLRLSLGDGQSDTVVVRHVQHRPSTGAIQHVDFMHVELTEPIRVRIPIRLEGEAPAVKTADGVLLQLLETLEVEALPGDLPPGLVLSVSDMATLKDVHYVRDLQVPPGVKVLTASDEPVVKIEPPRIAVEVAEVAPAQPPEEGEAAETPEAPA
jgi:large subunit ribosomal protein L25